MHEDRRTSDTLHRTLMGELLDELRPRMRRVLPDMPEDEFRRLLVRIALVKMKYHDGPLPKSFFS